MPIRKSYLRRERTAPAKARRNVLRTDLSLKRKLSFVFFSALVACSILAFYLHYLFRARTHFYISPPYSRNTFHPDPAVLPGVHGISHFNLNSIGIRGDELSDKQSYRILVMGASTVECLYLDYPKSWPALLQRKLNALRGGIWVGNAGKSGGGARAIILEMKYFVPQFPRFDTILILLGGNDLLQSICNGIGLYEPYDPNAMDNPRYVKQLMFYTFYVVPLKLRYSLYESLGLRTIGSMIKGRIKTMIFPNINRESDTGDTYIINRRIRQHAAEIVDTMPDLRPGLAEYAGNLNQIIDSARAQKTRVIFMTDPALWKAHMTPQEQSLLWMGRIRDERSKHHDELARFYSARVLAEGLAAYNQTLRNVCKRRGVEVIDLASKMNGDDASFYDDCHFNEHGAARIADIVTAYFKHRSPFIKNTTAKPEAVESKSISLQGQGS